jgi:hypothetical protein
MLISIYDNYSKKIYLIRKKASANIFYSTCRFLIRLLDAKIKCAKANMMRKEVSLYSR